MNIFEQFVIPPSSHTLPLMDIFLILSLLLFLPFIGMLIGGTTMSMILSGISGNTGDDNYNRFSRDILNKLSVNKNVGLGLGLIPAFSITFVYAQYLYQAPAIAISIMFIGCVIYIFAFLLTYRFHRTFETGLILDSYKLYIEPGKNLPADVIEYKKKNAAITKQSGRLGLFLLYVASFLFVGGASIATNPMRWAEVTNVIVLLIEFEVWINYLYFLSFSAAITCSAILFFFFKWQGGIKDMTIDYKMLVLKVAGFTGFFSVVLLLFFVFIKFLITTEMALSTSVFVYTTLAMISILIVCSLLYAVLKNHEVRFASAIFFFMILIFLFTSLKDQALLGNALSDHLAPIIAEQDKLIESKTQPIAQDESAIDGSQIYQTKCSACHKGDVKLVGPPYMETIPKYNGDIKKLAGFIYNPVKVNPEYPAMPSQGLSVAESEAVAKYLMDTYGGGAGGEEKESDKQGTDNKEPESK
ncbi:MAG: cytochrome c class I [Chlorobi bacterium OLB4]|jgi:cytochrome c|nr:MAG: cytochrome c class I [Chlorobi bacterium OLB4]MBW7855099.1 hypothetical protein [Ignavibacteria bacterium]OQY76714.1 MAG: hypothetical protein B6D43_08790 [Ignavibacteriales bacterium UTCHB1]